jgi:multiple sugar transport system substrate-binding protein
MRHSKLYSILIAILLIASLIACNNASNTGVTSATDETNQTTADQGTNTDEPATTDKKPVTLRYMVWGSPNEKKAVEDYSKMYMELNPNVTIEVIHVPNDNYSTKVATMVAGNDAPDIAYMSESQAYELAQQGKLVDIFQFLKTDPDFKLEDYAPNVFYEYEPGKALGRRIGIGAMGMYYNTEVFEKAGLPPLPRDPDQTLTWDEFVKLAQTLTIDQNGKNALDPAFDPNNIKQYGFMFETWWANYLPMVLSNGGSFVSEDGTKFGLSEPEAYEAIQKLADLINVYHVAPSPVQLKSLPNLATSLQTGKAAMAFGGNWLTLDLSAAKAKFGYGLFPKMKENASIILASPTVIFNSTKHLDEAWKFYKFAANPSAAIGIYADGLSIPVLKEWLTDEEKLNQWAVNETHPDGYVDVMIKPLFSENTKPGPVDLVKNYGKIDTVVTPALENVWLGKSLAKDAMTSIKPQVESLLEGVYKWSH